MLDTGIAYIFWVAGFFVGFPGLHRLYMRKYNAGTVLRFIPGIGHMIALIDLFIIPSQIREINLRAKYRKALHRRSAAGELLDTAKPKESLERVILRTGKKNKGIITPGEVALEADIPLGEAKKNLDEMASKGFVEIRVKKSGLIVYTLPEFMEQGEDDQLLDL